MGHGTFLCRPQARHCRVSETLGTFSDPRPRYRGPLNQCIHSLNCAVINAGDGRREHPTQALLDALTIINRKGKIEGLKIAICGDILHSRVARSNIYLMNMLGAEVNVIAPKTLMPKSIDRMGVKSFTDMKKGLDGCDIAGLRSSRRAIDA